MTCLGTAHHADGWLGTALIWLAWLGSGLAVALAGHTAVNATLLRRPPRDPPPVAGSIAVLLPVRDEAHRVAPCLAALLGQHSVPELRIVVLDDGSRDGTADLVREIAGVDPRVTIIAGTPPPPGWLGKPWACTQLAAEVPDARTLVFVDADVILAPDAIAAAMTALDGAGVALLSPYPRIGAVTVGERLVQPLLAWSWLTFLPLRAVTRSRRPSLAAAGGQFMLVTRAGYDVAGGHAAVRDRVLDDVELARAVKRSGGRIALADGSRIASCRMYASWPEVRDGYTKSLWASFGSPIGAAALVGTLLLGYVLPPLVAGLWVGGRWIGGRWIVGHWVVGHWVVGGWVGGLWVGGLWVPAVIGYCAGVAGRVIVAVRTGGRVWDSWSHPVSVVAFGYLVARSFRHRRLGRLGWKGRDVTPAPESAGTESRGTESRGTESDSAGAR